jgi:RNA polymerase sigma-70 factor (ECF subfamily)
METHAEQELLCRLAQGDQKALSLIYQQYWQCLFISAFNVLKDKKACEDIIQEIFLQLWLRREHLHIQESLKGYLLAATRYQVFRCIRQAMRQKEAINALATKQKPAHTESNLLQKELLQKVEAVVSVLPEKCRMIYRLSREEYLTHKEISERLHISPKTVENQLTIALRRLRHSLEGFMILLSVVHYC